MSSNYTSAMRTTMRLNNQVLTDAQQDKLEQTLSQFGQKPSLKSSKILPTRTLGKPLLKVDLSSNASIQEMLDKESVKPLSTGK
jgi:hypothetical protein